MPLFFASINSGSNANCYLVGNDSNALLIDAGLSCRETEKRMARLGLSMDRIDAVWITHEHHDHVSGLPSLIKKYKYPVFLTAGTLSHLPVPIEKECIRVIEAGASWQLGNLEVQTFSKYHDAADPVSMVVSEGNLQVGILTDIGHCCKEVKRQFAKCDAVFLESNYCEEMLANGRYTEALKKRIRGKNGHLSNRQALELFSQHGSPSLQYLILSHLSQNNNTQEKAQNTFLPHIGTTQLAVASRYKESTLYTLREKKNPGILHHKEAHKKNARQLRLF